MLLQHANMDVDWDKQKSISCQTLFSKLKKTRRKVHEQLLVKPYPNKNTRIVSQGKALLTLFFYARGH